MLELQMWWYESQSHNELIKYLECPMRNAKILAMLMPLTCSQIEPGVQNFADESSTKDKKIEVKDEYFCLSFFPASSSHISQQFLVVIRVTAMIINPDTELPYCFSFFFLKGQHCFLVHFDKLLQFSHFVL